MNKVDSNCTKSVPLDKLNNNTTSISDLPPEMLTEIFSPLNTNNQINCFLVNKDFQLASDEMKKNRNIEAFLPGFTKACIIMDNLGDLTTSVPLTPEQNLQIARRDCLYLTKIIVAVAFIAASVFIHIYDL
jgi:hypothetical protein